MERRPWWTRNSSRWIRDSLPIAVVLGASLLVWAPRLGGPIDLRYDAGVYYILGTALAEGRGYRLLNEPGEILAIQYPPALPAFVAAHQLALGTSDVEVVGRALRGSFAVLFAAYALCVYALARRYLPAWGSALVATITVLYSYSVFLSDLLFTEVPFALVTVAFVLVDRRGEGRAASVPTALLGAAAYLLRTAGIALLGAWVLEAVLGRRWRRVAVRAGFAMVLVASWQGYTGWVQSREDPDDPAYAYQRAPYQYYNVTYAENIRLVDPFVPELGTLTALDLRDRILANASRMPEALGRIITGSLPVAAVLRAFGTGDGGISPWLAWAEQAVPAAFGCLAFGGAALFLARREWLMPLYFAASLAMICLTPWPGQFNRYLTPLVPFYALFLVRLLASLSARTLGRWSWPWRLAGPAFFALVIGLTLGKGVFSVSRMFLSLHRPAPLISDEVSRHRLFFVDPGWYDFNRALAWLGEHARRDEVVATTCPHNTYLATGLRAVMPPMEADPERALELLDSVPARYLVVDQLEFVDFNRRYALPVIERYPDAWELVYTAPDGFVMIYRRADDRAG